MRKPACPKWIWILLGLLILGITIGAIYYFCCARKTANHIDPIIGQPIYSGNGTLVCSNGFFQNNGKCIACPIGSQWTGSFC